MSGVCVCVCVCVRSMQHVERVMQAACCRSCLLHAQPCLVTPFASRPKPCYTYLVLGVYNRPCKLLAVMHQVTVACTACTALQLHTYKLSCVSLHEPGLTPGFRQTIIACSAMSNQMHCQSPDVSLYRSVSKDCRAFMFAATVIYGP